MTINTSVHDKRAALWKKGAGSGQLRATVQTRYEMIDHRFHPGRLYKLEKVENQEFEVCMAYKSPWGIRWVAYALEIHMALFIISALGMCLKVVI